MKSFVSLSCESHARAELSLFVVSGVFEASAHRDQAEIWWSDSEDELAQPTPPSPDLIRPDHFDLDLLDD